jgi:hypothetical protein
MYSQPSAKCCLFCLEQLLEDQIGRQSEKGEKEEGLGCEESLESQAFQPRIRTFILPPCPLVSTVCPIFIFSCCFKYEIPSGGSDYKPTDLLHSSMYATSIFVCVCLSVCVRAYSPMHASMTHCH